MMRHTTRSDTAEPSYESRPRVARPLATAIAIAVGWAAVTTIGIAITKAAAPGLASQTQAFVVLIALSLLVAALLGALGWWHAAGFTAPRYWHNPWVLLLPAVVVTAPLLGGIRADLDAATVAVLLVGYLLTGFAEESVFRGVMLRVLSPRGVRSAVLISSLLFALVHLGNVVIRGNPAIVAAQAVGAFTSGIGYAAIYVWTGTIWAAIGVHFLHDLFLNLSGWPVILVDVIQDVVLVAYGVYLIWFREPPTRQGRPASRARQRAQP